MNINKLIGEYYIAEEVLDKIKLDNEKAKNGIQFLVSNPKTSLLYFLQQNFYFITQGDKLTHELVTYTHFIHQFDNIDISIRNLESNQTIINFENISASEIFIGKLKDKILKLSWIFPVKDHFILEIKKHENHNFTQDIIFPDSSYLIDLAIEITESFNIRGEPLVYPVKSFKGILEKYLSYVQKYDQGQQIYERLKKAFDHSQSSGDIFPLIACMGPNKKDFWKNNYNFFRDE